MARKPIYSYLIHLGYNMWNSADAGHDPYEARYTHATDYLRCERDVWDTVTKALQEAGCNTLIIDIGEGVVFPSHPELAVKGSWTAEELSAEVRRLRSLGMDVVPKLNFSACHDEWLGEYARMLSTPTYEKVVADVIADAMDIFDNPSYFHLGMDEETYQHQSRYPHAVIRQQELWWRDFYRMVGEVEKRGAQAWIWSDMIWHHKDEFLAKMPKSVLQSNWYYDRGIDKANDKAMVQAFFWLAEHGFEQVPAGSNWSASENLERLAAFCKEELPADKLMGIMQTVWQPTVKTTLYRQLDAVSCLKDAVDVLKG